MRTLLRRLLAQLKGLDQQVAEIKGEILTWHLHNEDSRRLERIGGFGPLTASALVASLGDAKSFKNGRQVAAWLGLVPRQDSSGGKTRPLGISKRGDVYLRTLLIGPRASSVLSATEPDWITRFSRTHSFAFGRRVDSIRRAKWLLAISPAYPERLMI
jgi:transposase